MAHAIGFKFGTLSTWNIRKILMRDLDIWVVVGGVWGNLEGHQLAPRSAAKIPGLRWNISQEDSPQEGSICRTVPPIELN